VKARKTQERMGILKPKIENPGGNVLRRLRLDFGHNTITYKKFLNLKKVKV